MPDFASTLSLHVNAGAVRVVDVSVSFGAHKYASALQLALRCRGEEAAAADGVRPLQEVARRAHEARRTATAISEWVGSAKVPRPPEALVADYRAAGLDYGPPSAPFETLGELGRVLGMTPAVMIGIRPHLTLFGPPEPNPATTDPVVAAALALSSTTGSLPARQPIVQPGQASPDNLTVRITALASGPGNARVTRTAVVRTAGTLPQGYAVLAWGTSLNSDAPLGLPPPPVTR